MYTSSFVLLCSSLIYSGKCGTLWNDGGTLECRVLYVHSTFNRGSITPFSWCAWTRHKRVIRVGERVVCPARGGYVCSVQRVGEVSEFRTQL